jgi:hypothetical protein
VFDGLVEAVKDGAATEAPERALVERLAEFTADRPWSLGYL